MRKVFAIIAAIILTICVYAQAPQKMSYQAVIRNSSNSLVTNKNVGMKISILKSSVTGTVVYAETQMPTTNANGLLSIEIGNGTQVSGGFSTIDWSNGPYFIKTETDPTGGNNYTISGTSELLSVPYTLYANNALLAKNVEMNADGGYLLNYHWAGNIKGNNWINLSPTNVNWKGNRKIMLNGYVHLEFKFPQEALDNHFGSGTADVDMYLKYNGQTIMPLSLKNIQIRDSAIINLPINAFIPKSTAGNSMQFSLYGLENTSKTELIGSGQYPIDVTLTLVWYWLEL